MQIVEYCKHHSETPEAPVPEHDKYRTDNIIEWDKNFMQVDMEMLFNIVLVRIQSVSLPMTVTHSCKKQQAANYLDIRGLLDLGCKTIANHMKGLFFVKCKY